MHISTFEGYIVFAYTTVSLPMQTLGSVMLTICKEINKQQKLHDPPFDASKMTAMDIGCGYHSYMFAIARCQAQVNIIRN